MIDERLKKDLAILPISTVRALTNLSDRQIRYYESQDLLTTKRGKGGQRRFSLNDVERLIEIRTMMESGDSLKDIHSLYETNRVNSRRDEKKDFVHSLENEFLKIGRLEKH
ncbi:MerR family transcriptional regulator [Oenococcus kitaharae]|uniref:MerR family transcriptional regulator n=1 Tax=Oenococcus kitaharae DSM 17330 TaxID=1045004 RepID=G9WFZ6_9LACO|nr:MerR family transcriptional regulator [Oenococcus kitaharae]EHN59574.1 MerR family transcriptional regulator [Oenococcus kitaharae DSM 17330]MCV3295749.1 MerR family transcriptional regulator [Oenococcus kitaharae]OEY83423.1 glutamine synthetase [Oenococcus kitaharae]OEY85222.1 glutamine synthetase [Oenococcus kitaharae]OEY86076.1 glutamine synthetase [Oenococcus kitaharae]